MVRPVPPDCFTGFLNEIKISWDPVLKLLSDEVLISYPYPIARDFLMWNPNNKETASNELLLYPLNEVPTHILLLNSSLA